MCVIEELDGADSRYLLDVVHELDAIYIREMYEKIAKDRAKSQKKTQSAARGRGRR
jgi:hypothetical protein